MVIGDTFILANPSITLNDEEALKLYNRAYKTHHARVRNGLLNKEELSSWCSKAKGKLGIASFQEWLKD